ncbi:hypothetical protein [Bordetella genomosp. 9]|uniref:hypothetical protein n=1 Tax=Bordetella genomosp. 9 TaxID=1416803 RepID=UPI0012F8FE18|nr:hypothetical protein [Bordetella genomosp. 9]
MLERPWRVRPWSYRFVMVELAVQESIGMARYGLWNAMGWNPPRADAALAGCAN